MFGDGADIGNNSGDLEVHSGMWAHQKTA